MTADWAATSGEAIRITVTAWDEHELPARLELSPWSYDLPHEDVVFQSGSAEITLLEAPKLEATYGDLEQVLARYGAVVEVRLFVAGFTDTVGSATSNQTLSEARARAIAAWFRERGFTGRIDYQGFGEAVPKVPCADETPEERNRRALYLLAAEAPPLSTGLPRSDWRPVP
jgi:outer membrane protein OmpA-like peptidoglycan-associated protein